MKRIWPTLLLLPSLALAKELTYDGFHNIRLDGKKYTETKTRNYLLVGRKYRDLDELTNYHHDLESLQWRYETQQLIGSSLVNLSIPVLLLALLNSPSPKALVPAGLLIGAGVGVSYWSMQTLKAYTEEYNLIHNRPTEIYGSKINYSWSF